MWDPYADFESTTLPNGLTIYSAHWPERPWEAMGFLVYTGAKHDPVGLEGLTHFVEHLVSNNTIVPHEELKEFFEHHGGGVSCGTTSFHATSYDFFVPADKAVFAQALTMFGHMLLHAKLEAYIERERGVITAEFYERFKNTFSLDLEKRKRNALYSGDWLERHLRPLGYPESVKRIVQNDLQECYDTHYTPANLSIVGVGGMTHAEIAELVHESPFAADKKGKRTPLPSPVMDLDPPTENQWDISWSQYVADSVAVKTGSYASFAKLPGNENPRAIEILMDMLEHVFNHEIREKRAWVYSVDVSCDNLGHLHEFSVGCSGFTVDAQSAVSDAVNSCIESLAHKEDLFERMKKDKVAKNTMHDVPGRGIRDNAMGDLSEYQRILTIAEEREQTEQVTMDDIRRLLRWLTPNWRWTMIARP